MTHLPEGWVAADCATATLGDIWYFQQDLPDDLTRVHPKELADAQRTFLGKVEGCTDQYWVHYGWKKEGEKNVTSQEFAAKNYWYPVAIDFDASQGW